MAVLVIGSTATASLVSGLSLWLVAAITLAVALAGAVVARRAVASLFAGLSLLVIRPYAPGEQLRLHSHADDSVLDVEVVRIGLVNSTLATPSGLLVLPNSSLLRGTF
jgi:small-conductance mechanosensitive channel